MNKISLDTLNEMRNEATENILVAGTCLTNAESKAEQARHNYDHIYWLGYQSAIDDIIKKLE